MCDQVPTVANRTGIILLQHRKERDHPLGTARFVRLGLQHQQIHVLLGQRGASERVVLPAGAALLYPGPDARDLATLPAHARPEHLVLLDATWPLAHQLYRDNPWIRALPQVRFDPASPSRYRIRPEPREDYVSTLEAAVGALRVLEPELRGLDELLGAFDHMIDQQVDAGDRSGAPRRRRPRQRPSREIPGAVRVHDDRVVVAAIEPGLPDAAGAVSPFHVTAVRWRDGAVLDLIDAEGVGDEAFMGGLGLTPGVPRTPSTEALFADFCGSDARVMCWSRRSAELAARSVGRERCVRLKPVWTNRARSRRVSHLDAIAADLGLAVPTLGARGRAGRRLDQTDAILRYLREIA